MSAVKVDPLFDPEVIEDPHPYYAALRDHDPVHRVEGTDAFLVCRWNLIQEVISDPSTYSSRSDRFLYLGPGDLPGLRSAGGGPASLPEDIPSALATADPPDHGRQRKV